MANETKYPWKDAPEWANYAATDSDGDKCWFEFEPTLAIHTGVWRNDQEGRMVMFDDADDWKKSLEKRPAND